MLVASTDLADLADPANPARRPEAEAVMSVAPDQPAATTGWVRVCDVAGLPAVDEAVCVTYDGEPVAIFNLNGEYFAVADTCTHAQSSLSEEGWVERGRVECGFHGAQFDLRTGAVCRLPARLPLKTYVVDVRGADVWLRDGTG